MLAKTLKLHKKKVCNLNTFSSGLMTSDSLSPMESQQIFKLSHL